MLLFFTQPQPFIPPGVGVPRGLLLAITTSELDLIHNFFMATEILFKESQYYTTSLNVGGGIDASQRTGIILASTTGVDTSEPGIALLSYSNPLNVSVCEWVAYTSISGSNELQGVIRGFDGYPAKTHANGVTIAFPHSKSHINNLVNAVRTGWVGEHHEWTFATTSSFTVPSNMTSTFSKGTKIRLKQNNGDYKYFYVLSSVFSTVTTVNLTGGNDYALTSDTITDSYYSHSNSPIGFPEWFSFTPTYSAIAPMTFTTVTTDLARFKITGKMAVVKVSCVGSTGGTASAALTVSLPIDISSNDTLSSNLEGSGMAFDGPATDTAALVYRNGSSTSQLAVYKSGLANFGLGATRGFRIVANYEI